MQFTSKRTRKYPRLTDLIIIGMRDKGVNIHFPVSHMVFLSSTSLHNRYVGWSLKVKPIRNNSRYFFVFRIVASVRNVFGGTWSVERCRYSCQKFATLFHPLFLPLFDQGPRPGCFWIQRAERRNQRSSVCVDDSLDNQLVSKLPDGRPAVEQNWKFSLPSLRLSVCPRSVRPLLPFARAR